MNTEHPDDLLIKPSQDYLTLLAEAQRLRESQDPNEVCNLPGWDREEIELILDTFRDSAESFSLDELEEDGIGSDYIPFEISPKEKMFELTDWPMPVDDRYLLSHDLDYSAFFIVDTSAEAAGQCLKLANKKYAKAIKKYGVPDLLDDFFIEAFGDGLGYPVLNTFFWILFHKGKDWISVRSYAIEILKWISDFVYFFFDDYESFIKTFSLFTHNVLCNMGICTLETEPTPKDTIEGTYSIQATDAFYSLLKPSEDALVVPMEE